MAVIFQLWIECDNEADLLSVREYFDDSTYELSNGRTIRFCAYFEESGNPEVPGLSVWSPQGSSFRGVENLDDALEATEVGAFFYSRLRTSPDFRFARVDWDADRLTASDLPESFEKTETGQLRTNLQCVVNNDLFKELGAPAGFWKFREGYWWRKFRGETYEPLYSTDQASLRGRCQALLPDNFDYTGETS